MCWTVNQHHPTLHFITQIPGLPTQSSDVWLSFCVWLPTDPLFNRITISHAVSLLTQTHPLRLNSGGVFLFLKLMRRLSTWQGNETRTRCAGADPSRRPGATFAFNFQLFHEQIWQLNKWWKEGFRWSIRQDCSEAAFHVFRQQWKCSGSGSGAPSAVCYPNNPREEQGEGTAMF